jgi:DnaD/phage-associated family protein
MKSIQLHTDMPRNITMIPNEFLDHYMSGANGEFLKIYLYLLRWAGCPGASITTTSIADFFNMTENDVKRALRFWEQEGLLRTAWDEAGNITAICLKPVTAPYPQQTAPTVETDTRSRVEATGTTAALPTTHNEAAIPVEKKSDYQVPSYSMTDLQTFMEEESGDQLFFIIQQYTGKPLSQSDMNTILFFYDELGMSQDLIEHLFEYCISNGHRKMNYIQAVAIGWTESGIKTVDDAKAYCSSFNQTNAAVMNAFGIKGRYLTEDELCFIRRWNQEYHFSQELIAEACRRTILTAHTASFQYADKILKGWRDRQASTLEDIHRLDAAFDKARAEKKQASQENHPQKTPAARKPASRFHNFNQRSYDYSDMEVEFVRKLHSGSPQ